MFNRPVVATITTKLSGSGIAVSPVVKSRKRTGRHTIAITAVGGTAYIGGADVSADNGQPIAENTTYTIPVDTTRTDNVYYSGDIILTEFF